MKLIMPDNMHLLNRLTPFEQSEFLRTRTEAAKLAEDFPALNTRVFTQYMHDYLEAGVKHRAEMTVLKTNAREAGTVPDPNWLLAESVGRRNVFVKDFEANVLPQYGSEGREAMEKLNRRLQPPTTTRFITHQFYNEDTKGLRLGGLIGGALGGWFIFTKLGGWKNKVKSLIGGALAALAGAWLVNKTIEGYGKFFNKKPGPNVPDASESSNTLKDTKRRLEQPPETNLDQPSVPDGIASTAKPDYDAMLRAAPATPRDERAMIDLENGAHVLPIAGIPGKSGATIKPSAVIKGA